MILRKPSADAGAMHRRRGAKFARGEDGAVTVDFVVLTAAVVGLAIVVMNVVGGSVRSSASSIGTGVQASGKNIPTMNFTTGPGG